MTQARFVREAIETAIVERCCESFDPTSRARLDHLLALQESFAQAGDHNQFQRYDELFHIALAEGAGCPLAWEALSDIKAHMDRLCQLTLMSAEAMLPLVADHREIVAAIDARDPERARAAMRHHLTAILRALPQVEAEHPELFER
jgi:DNA-binding GntR family transcriptional regulator